MKKTGLFKKACMLMLALTVIGTSVDMSAMNVQAASAKKITLSATKATVYVGRTTKLTVKKTTGLNNSKKVKWSTSNKKVATVKSNGTVTGVKVGKATITATSTKNKKVKATCKVTVKGASKVVINSAKTIYLKKGKKTTLKTTVTTQGKNTKVTWTSSNKKFATVTSKGKVVAKKAGRAKITATTADGSKKKASVTVVVPRKKMTNASKVTVKAAATTLTVGGTTTVKATVTPSKATYKKVYWSTNNASVATVDQNGKIKAVKAGKATITATAQDGSKKSGKTTITVVNPPVVNPPVVATSVSVNPTKLSLTTGDKATLTATVAPANTADKAVTWATSNARVATVSNGAVTAVAAGTATITVRTTNGKTATCAVTVMNPPSVADVASVTVTAADETTKVAAGSTLQLTAAVLPENATDKTVTWSTSDATAATVSATGLVTGLNAGIGKTVVITATANNGVEGTYAVLVTGSIDARADTEVDYKYVVYDNASKYDVTYNLNASTSGTKTVTDVQFADYVNSAQQKAMNILDNMTADSYAEMFAKITAEELAKFNIPEEVTVDITTDGNVKTVTVTAKDVTKTATITDNTDGTYTIASEGRELTVSDMKTTINGNVYTFTCHVDSVYGETTADADLRAVIMTKEVEDSDSVVTEASLFVNGADVESASFVHTNGAYILTVNKDFASDCAAKAGVDLAGNMSKVSVTNIYE